MRQTTSFFGYIGFLNNGHRDLEEDEWVPCLKPSLTRPGNLLGKAVLEAPESHKVNGLEIRIAGLLLHNLHLPYSTRSVKFTWWYALYCTKQAGLRRPLRGTCWDDSRGDPILRQAKDYRQLLDKDHHHGDPASSLSVAQEISTLRGKLIDVLHLETREETSPADRGKDGQAVDSAQIPRSRTGGSDNCTTDRAGCPCHKPDDEEPSQSRDGYAEKGSKILILTSTSIIDEDPNTAAFLTAVAIPAVPLALAATRQRSPGSTRMNFECDKRTPEEKEQRGPDRIRCVSGQSTSLILSLSTGHALAGENTNNKVAVSDNSRSPSPDAAHAAKRLRREGAPVTTASDRHDRESAEPDELPTIDEIESRPKLPLPQRTPAQQAAMNSPPFVYPDPADMTGLPAMKDQNPAHPGVAARPRPRGGPRRRQAHRAVHLRHLPSHCRLFYQEHKHANRDALAFVKTFAAAGMDIGDIDIALPIPRHKPKSDFDGPWPMIMTGASEELAKFLTWHQTFAVNRKLSFHALRFDPDLDSWFVRVTMPSARPMGVIKKKLWHYPRFRALCNDIMTAEGVTGTIDQRVVRATDTFDLTLIHTDDQHGVSTPPLPAHCQTYHPGCQAPPRVGRPHPLPAGRRLDRDNDRNDDRRRDSRRDDDSRDRRGGNRNDHDGGRKGRKESRRSNDGWSVNTSDRGLGLGPEKDSDVSAREGKRLAHPCNRLTPTWYESGLLSGVVLEETPEHWGHGYTATDNSGQATPEGVNAQPSATPPMKELLFSATGQHREVNGSSGKRTYHMLPPGQEQRPDAPGADTYQAPTTARQGGGAQSERQLQSATYAQTNSTAPPRCATSGRGGTTAGESTVGGVPR
ncbi:hypothetical protein B0H14DRAFT_2576489 [Mycena olivaceomarginata]|nr:hypothetical protein B0H14DRAFT_2576489 [Mycena olivaceomarginata]